MSKKQIKLQVCNRAGELYILGSSFFLALSTVITHIFTRESNPVLIVFYSFSIAFLLLFFIRLHHTKLLLQEVAKNWSLVLANNLSTSIDWILIFIALKYTSGSLVNCFVFGIAPIATLLLSIKSYTSKRQLIKDALTSSIICLLLFLLSRLYYQQVDYSVKTNLILGIGLCCLSGVATGITALTCKSLFHRGFSNLDIMKTRYILLIITAYFILIILKIDFTIDLLFLLKMLCLSVIFVLLPAILFQKGIKRISSVSVIIINSFIPAMTYFLQLLDPNYRLDIKELILILLLSMTILIAILYRRN